MQKNYDAHTLTTFLNILIIRKTIIKRLIEIVRGKKNMLLSLRQKKIFYKVKNAI